MSTIATGYDYSFSHPAHTALRAAGASFVVRYLYPPSQTPGSKNLTATEAAALRGVGLDIVSNFESWASRAREGYTAGTADAYAAVTQHRNCGGPPARPIYFSVDYDADPVAVVRYFQGVNAVIGTGRTGVYGSFRVVKALIDGGFIGRSDPAHFYAWQAYAWSGGQYDERCALAQDENGIPLGGGTVDLDSAHCPDYGQWGWHPGTPPLPAKDDDMAAEHWIANDTKPVRHFLSVAGTVREFAAADGIVLCEMYGCSWNTPEKSKQLAQIQVAQRWATSPVATALTAAVAHVGADVTALGADVSAVGDAVGKIAITVNVDPVALADAIAERLNVDQSRALLDALAARLAQ